MLRDATDSDVESIRRWRNHPKVRAASIWTDEITPDGHADWWARVRTDSRKAVLVFEYHGRACGVVTINDLDRDAGTAEWGFFLDVDGLESRRELLPAWIELEREAIAYGFDSLGLARMGGRTLAWNAQVLALHRRFGFVEVQDREYFAQVAGVEQRVVWTELIAGRRESKARVPYDRACS